MSELKRINSVTKNFIAEICFFIWTRCCMFCVCHNTPTQKQLFCLHVFLWGAKRKKLFKNLHVY